MAAAAASLFRRASSNLARLPQSLLPSISLDSPFAYRSSSPGCGPSLPSSFGASMELMAVPKKKVSKYKKRLRNGPKALKPIPVNYINVRCRSCGRVRLPHFYCCSGEIGNSNGASIA